MVTHHTQVTEVPIQTLLHPGKYIVTKVIELVRYKSLMNCKRHQKGNNMFKFYSNKIMVFGLGGNIILFLSKLHYIKIYFKSIEDRKDMK